MRKFLGLLIFGCCFPVMVFGLSSSNAWENIGDFVERSVVSMMSASTPSEESFKVLSRSHKKSEVKEFALSEVAVRIQSQIGFTVPWSSSLKLVPELEIGFAEEEL